MAAKEAFYKTVTAAVDDLLEHGYDSQARLNVWLERLRAAARNALVPESELARALRSALTLTFKRATGKRAMVRVHPGVAEFTLARIAPRLHAELDRRIAASTDLIKLNRQASIESTLQRFAGWATSVPAGGTEVAKRKVVKETVRRGIAGLPFTERRVVIDQSAKLVASIHEIIATDGGAIAAQWNHVPEGPPAYDARPDHVARDGKVYLLRKSWATDAGLVKLAGRQYTDEITAPAVEPFCRCSYTFLYTLRDLPGDMLTLKGKTELELVRRA